MTTANHGLRLPPRESLSILVVDDHRDAADSLAELLRIFGHGVEVAYDADAGLRAVTPDMVILELRLPRLNGWEMVRLMREREAVRCPLFVAVTTCSSKDERRRSEEAGIDIHLVKPVEPNELFAVIGQMCAWRGSD